MKSLLIGMLILTGVSVAHAKDERDAWIKCLVDGEKQGVSNKDCPAFEKALGCQAQLLQFYEGHLNDVKAELVQVKKEWSSSKSAKRRELFARAIHEAELAVGSEEKAVAQSKDGDAILRREKHEAGCN
jgi:hypothetical protein